MLSISKDTVPLIFVLIQAPQQYRKSWRFIVFIGFTFKGKEQFETFKYFSYSVRGTIFSKLISLRSDKSESHNDTANISVKNNNTQVLKGEELSGNEIDTNKAGSF